MPTVGENGDITLKVGFDQSAVNKGFNSIKSGANSLQNTFTRLGKIIASAFAVRQIMAFAKSSKASYDAQIEAETKLTVIMNQRMKATQAQVDACKDLAGELQNIGVVGDDILLSGAQQVATFLTEAESVKTLMPAIGNLLAQQYGVNATSESAVSIGNMMGKVLQGQTSALKRVGITFSNAQEEALKYGNESQRVATLAQVITDNVGEMNKALAATDAGKQKQMANTWDDVKEKIGAVVNQIITLFMPAITNFVNWISKAVDYVSAFVSALFGTSNSTVSISDKATDALKGQTEAVEGLTDANKEAAKTMAAFDTVNVLTQNTAESTASDIDTGTGAGGITGTVTDSSKGNRILDIIDKIKDSEFGQGALKFFSTMKTIVTSAWNKIWEVLKTVMGFVFKIIGDISPEDAEKIGEALGILFAAILGIKIVTGLIGFISGIGQAIGGLLSILTAHPLLSLAAGIVALFSALYIDDRIHRNDWIKDLASDWSDMADDINAATEATNKFCDDVDSEISALDDKYKPIYEAAQRFDELYKKIDKTNEEQAEYRKLAGYLVEEVPDLRDIIGETGEKYNGQYEAIIKNIDAMKELAVVEVAKEEYGKAVSNKREQQENYDAAETAYLEGLRKLKSAQDLLDEYQKHLDEASILDPFDLITSYNQVENQREVVNELTEALSPLKDAYEEAGKSLDRVTGRYEWASEIMSGKSQEQAEAAAKAAESNSKASREIQQAQNEAAINAGMTVEAYKRFLDSAEAAAKQHYIDGSLHLKDFLGEISTDISDSDAPEKAMILGKNIGSNIASGFEKSIGQTSEKSIAYDWGKSIAENIAAGYNSGDVLPGLSLPQYVFNYSKYLQGARERRAFNVPKLASGTVIPANRPFLAMLGDQTSGTNVEAPLSTIKQAVAEVLGSYGGGFGGGTIVLELDGRSFARAAVPAINKENARLSVKAVNK